MTGKSSQYDSVFQAYLVFNSAF